MLVSIRSNDLPCLAHDLTASVPLKEKGMPLCPTYQVVRGFLSVVVQTWLHVP